MKENNYEKYWHKHWRVKQTPKFDFEAIAWEGWEVYDNNIGGASTIAKHDDITLKVEYVQQTGGVDRIIVSRGGNIIYNQRFDFLLKPSVAEIEKVLKLIGFDNWEKYYTSC